MRTLIKEIRTGINNVIRWFPTIWKDRDWDDHYIVEILIKKLEFQRDFFASDKAYSAEADNVVKEIQQAIDMLRKTADSWEHYELPAHDAFELKWGPSTQKFVPYNEHSYELIIEHDKVKTPEDAEQCSKDLRDSLQTAREKYMEDKRNAYLYIAENIDKWWD